MKNLNKKLFIAWAIFLVPAFALADMEMGDGFMSNWSMTMSSSWMFQKQEDFRFKPLYWSWMLMWSWMTQETKSKMEELRKSLEEQIKTLRESITKDNLDEIKTKAESLKQEYLQKLDDLGLAQFKPMIEERFRMFFENNLAKREEMKKLVDERKEKIEKSKQDFKDFVENGSWSVKEARETMKQDIQKTKLVFQANKQDLKAKYKEQFAKTLETKLTSMSAEKIKAVIAKIEQALSKYTSNETLTQAQKDKFVAQLNALKDIMQDKLDELENGINLDELLN